jgi:hypothetical protein
MPSKVVVCNVKGLADEDGGREASKGSPTAEFNLEEWKREIQSLAKSVSGLLLQQVGPFT